MPQRMLSCGFAFDNSAIGTPMRTVSLPVGDQYRFGASVQYAYSKKITFGLADELMYQGNLPIYQNEGPVRGTVAGQYTNTFFNFFSLNMIYKFGID